MLTEAERAKLYLIPRPMLHLWPRTRSDVRSIEISSLEQKKLHTIRNGGRELKTPIIRRPNWAKVARGLPEWTRQPKMPCGQSGGKKRKRVVQPCTGNERKL